MLNSLGQRKPESAMNRHERRAAAAIARHADHDKRVEGAQKQEMLQKAQRMVTESKKANDSRRRANLRRINAKAAVEGIGQVHIERRKNRYAPDPGEPSAAEYNGQI